MYCLFYRLGERSIYLVINSLSQSFLLVEETEEPGENYRPVASHWQTLSHNVVSSTASLSGVHVDIGIRYITKTDRC
jgi:hypothetical protein